MSLIDERAVERNAVLSLQHRDGSDGGGSSRPHPALNTAPSCAQLATTLSGVWRMPVREHLQPHFTRVRSPLTSKWDQPGLLLRVLGATRLRRSSASKLLSSHQQANCSQQAHSRQETPRQLFNRRGVRTRTAWRQGTTIAYKDHRLGLRTQSNLGRSAPRSR
jgi:hypothetical protein